MVAGDRQIMLKDLGLLVKVGQHANIAGLIGVCEEPGESPFYLFLPCSDYQEMI